MARAGAAAQRSVVGGNTRAQRLRVVRDEVAGTRRTLALVFVLLVVMTGVAAFAVGGLITMQSDASESARAAASVGPERLAAIVGRLANPTPTVPDPFDTPEPTAAPPGIIAPPIIGLTPGTDDNPPETGTSPLPTWPAAGSPATGVSPSCTPGSVSSAAAGGAAVPVVPVVPLGRCP